MSLPVFAQDTGSTSNKKVTSLLEQRRDVLKTRLAMLEALFRAGKRTTPEEVIAARDDLLDAEFEVASDRAQRVAVLQKKLTNAKQFEALMKRRKNDARATEADVLMATARRLAVEIELAREE
jgi:hypothetical protein